MVEEVEQVKPLVLLEAQLTDILPADHLEGVLVQFLPRGVRALTEEQFRAVAPLRELRLSYRTEWVQPLAPSVVATTLAWAALFQVFEVASVEAKADP